MVLFPEGKPGRRETFDEYCSAGGYEALGRNLQPAEILSEVTQSGLRGRGGAGFPRKEVDRRGGNSGETSIRCL